ncbi:hypothetical protein BGW80DRAFT_1468390 [Lactifluus volemus]|nr:hypothetical protein BGW80DRAFT_1468390 [Lactifluus volemus]
MSQPERPRLPLAAATAFVWSLTFLGHGPQLPHLHAHEARHHQKESLSLQTPLEHPTPTLPSPSLSASGGSSGRPGTRPLRSSPLANTPVSGGDEEEVKGEKPTAQKPRPASPKATTPVVKVEPWIDQTNRIAPPAKERPMTPPPLATTKGAALSNKPSFSSATAAPIVASPVPMLNLSSFSLGAADAKPVVDGSTNIAIPSVFAGLKPGQLSLSPKPEASNAETPSSAPDTKPLPTLGTAPKLPFGASFGALPLAAAPATMTPPKDAAPLEPMAREFMSLYTELDLELAKLGKLSREQREQWATRPGSAPTAASRRPEVLNPLPST